MGFWGSEGPFQAFNSVSYTHLDVYKRQVYDVKAQSAYVVNTDTNIIVYEKDSQKQVSAGGLTKYMTIALLLPNYAEMCIRDRP